MYLSLNIIIYLPLTRSSNEFDTSFQRYMLCEVNNHKGDTQGTRYVHAGTDAESTRPLK